MSVTTGSALRTSVDRVLERHRRVRLNPSRARLIEHALEAREALRSRCGALATWTPKDSTGRSPANTFIVRRPQSETTIDWTSPNCLPLDPATFESLWKDALAVLDAKPQLWVTERVAGADPGYAMPIRTVTDRALHALFTDNMFRPVPPDIEDSVFAEFGYELLVLPYDRIDPARYDGRLRELAIVMDFDLRCGIVFGSSYCGSVKKLIFTAMNYALPAEGILPLHCAANAGEDGSTALMLGLSGTGKTSLSADPDRALIGDDEHGWSDDGIANFEGGCYAKLINLRPDREAEIFRAVFHEADPLEHGAIVENCMVYPNGEFDVDDERLTPNSRGSYPLHFLDNVKSPPIGGHPATILFLTADANGVLPPVARLDTNQAMLWFLMGYTSKLAGTETGIVEPRTTFSRFFGAPFMPRNPADYAGLLGDKLAAHGTRVFLVNTGWSGGPYGEGERMDIRLTRSIVRAALSGELDDVAYDEDPLFHVGVPRRCPGVRADVLRPRNTWRDPAAYDRRARRLADEFAREFESAYGAAAIDPAVAAQCPGR